MSSDPAEDRLLAAYRALPPESQGRFLTWIECTARLEAQCAMMRRMGNPEDLEDRAEVARLVS